MTGIHIVGTGSSGNTYLLESNRQILVVECGCRFQDIVEPFYSKFGCVGGVILSHRHHDHLNMSTAKEFMRRGVSVFCHEEVIKDAGLSGFSPLYSGQINKVGQFSIQTFPAPHNVPNYGFLITTPTKERILFLTDTTGVNLRFKDLDCIMVECNHDDDTLLDNLDRHEVSPSHPENHLGLSDCVEFCRNNVSQTTRQIVLIHLSHENINEDMARGTVMREVPFGNVAVAHKGDKFIIENDDF